MKIIPRHNPQLPPRPRDGGMPLESPRQRIGTPLIKHHRHQLPPAPKPKISIQKFIPRDLPPHQPLRPIRRQIRPPLEQFDIRIVIINERDFVSRISHGPLTNPQYNSRQ